MFVFETASRHPTLVYTSVLLTVPATVIIAPMAISLWTFECMAHKLILRQKAGSWEDFIVYSFLFIWFAFLYCILLRYVSFVLKFVCVCVCVCVKYL